MSSRPTSLLDRARALQARKGPPCTLRVLLESLDATERADLEAVVADGAINATTIAALLREDGRPIGEDTIRRHRTGRCACGKLA